MSTPITTLDPSQHQTLPESSPLLFAAKAEKGLSFEKIASQLGRNEVATAAIFYGQARATEEDVSKLSSILDLPRHRLAASLPAFPDRGRSVDMPPRDPLIYRLYEVVQNYGF
ncbi:hypothetical protein CP533_3099 [Ophiocordyceps camponoti-saundersi (nom. inval.)]|nr:hypothetical protein CP533_3099 [Ophiocordyceps camponoti-saundersi (nom. inval.)]